MGRVAKRFGRGLPEISRPAGWGFAVVLGKFQASLGRKRGNASRREAVAGEAVAGVKSGEALFFGAEAGNWREEGAIFQGGGDYALAETRRMASATKAGNALLVFRGEKKWGGGKGQWNGSPKVSLAARRSVRKNCSAKMGANLPRRGEERFAPMLGRAGDRAEGGGQRHRFI